WVSASVKLKISISSSSRTTLYKVYSPSGSLICDSSVNEGDTDTCTVNSTEAGVYTVVTRRWNNSSSTAKYSLSASYVSTNGCDSGDDDGDMGWINCKSELPNSDRDLAAEKTNFATWYSYHRTRIKAAKAGAA